LRKPHRYRVATANWTNRLLDWPLLCYRLPPPDEHNSILAGYGMNPPNDREQKKGTSGNGDKKSARLAEQLRANLQRRKAQARSRREGAADSRPEGLLKEADDNLPNDS
jgi:hypothetical protein